MARKLYGSFDISDNELQNARIQMLPSDPTGLEAKVYYNTAAHELRYHDGTSWKALGVAGTGGPPSGAAGGDLSGTYPSPQIAAGVIVDADVNSAAAIAQSKIASLTTDLAARVLKAGDTMGGFLTLSADPTNGLHAATKNYVDLTAQGLDAKGSVKVATTANVTQSGTQTIDGVAVVALDRVLCKDQTTASQNGIWQVQAGAWLRVGDMDSWAEVPSAYTWVEQGTVNSDTGWVCTADQGGTLGSTAITWVQFASAGTVQAGAGLTKTGNTIDIVAADGTINVGADSINVLHAPKWSNTRTISLTGDVTGTANIDGSANVSIATVGGGKRYAAALTASTSQVVTHNLNTQDVLVQVYNSASPYQEIDVEVQHTSVNTITVIATPALPTGYRVVVLA